MLTDTTADTSDLRIERIVIERLLSASGSGEGASELVSTPATMERAMEIAPRLSGNVRVTVTGARNGVSVERVVWSSTGDVTAEPIPADAVAVIEAEVAIEELAEAEAELVIEAAESELVEEAAVEAVVEALASIPPPPAPAAPKPRTRGPKKAATAKPASQKAAPKKTAPTRTAKATTAATTPKSTKAGTTSSAKKVTSKRPVSKPAPAPVKVAKRTTKSAATAAKPARRTKK